MKKLVAVLGALLFVMATTVVAAERTVWVGRDVDNSRVFWTCSNTDGDDWTLKRNGGKVGTYETVTNNAEFMELQAKGSRDFDRVRLYKDKLSMNVKGSKLRWVTMVTGKWGD